MSAKGGVPHPHPQSCRPNFLHRHPVRGSAEKNFEKNSEKFFVENASHWDGYPDWYVRILELRDLQKE